MASNNFNQSTGDVDTPSMPELRQVSLSRPILPPSEQIKTDLDVEEWKKSTGYKDYCLWIVRLNASVIGHDNVTISASPKSEVSCLLVHRVHVGRPDVHRQLQRLSRC
jgi:hypothetical protein